jgi:hypothetical protein
LAVTPTHFWLKSGAVRIDPPGMLIIRKAQPHGCSCPARVSADKGQLISRPVARTGALFK